MTATAFSFEVDRRLRPLSRAFLIHPETCTMIVDDERVVVLFGRWRFAVALANIARVTVTGPYSWRKVAGPPRMGLDRSATFATTAAAGVQLDLVRPVPAIEPFAFVKHPSVTVTVADPESVAAAIRAAQSRVRSVPDAAQERERAWPYRRGSGRQALRALLRWRRRDDRSVVHRTAESVTIDPDALPPDPEPEEPVQRLEDGVGQVYHRRYTVEVATDLSPADAMARVHADMNRLCDDRLAPVNKLAGEIGVMRPGDRLVVALAGPWSGPVEVVDLTETSFRLATLPGHLEAGQIEFRATTARNGLRFEIESWARSGSRSMSVLYELLGIARSLQAEMWVEACEAFAAATGRQRGPVAVFTERS